MSNVPVICPSCRGNTLRRTEIEPLLPAFCCERCHGKWLHSEDYFRWLEHPDRKPVELSQAAVTDVRDSNRAMLCPECGKLLTRYQVGHGVDFFIDRWAGCGGIWLDANEWESLQKVHLTEPIHFIFSTAWQAENLRQAQEQSVRERLVERVGAERFEELKRLTDWVAVHPHRQEIRAYLMSHL